MSDSVLSSGSARRQAEELAAEGKWSAVWELLARLEISTLVADGALAYLYAEALYHTGRMAELGGYAVEYEAAARQVRDTGAVLRALNLQGIAAFELGDTATARERFDALMELASAERDDDMLARAANNLGSLANLRGNPEEALTQYQLALVLYQRLGHTRGLGQTHHNLGMSYRDLGRLDDAVAAYREAIRLAESIGYRPLVAMSTAGRAEVELRRDDARLAERLAERALSVARDVGDPISESEALRIRGLATSSLDDLGAAARLARETRNALMEAEIERDIGQLLLQRGDRRAARARLDAAAERFERIGAEAEARAAREAAAPTEES